MSDQKLPDDPQPPYDYKKWLHELKRQDAQRAHDKLDEFHGYVNKAAMQGGELALRMAILINGAAAISLLTFIGKLPKYQQHAVANTLVYFASGVGLGVAGIALAYLTNYFMAGIAGSKLRIWDHPYVQDGPTTKRFIILNIAFHILALAAGIASIVCFAWGILDVRDALTHL